MWTTRATRNWVWCQYWSIIEEMIVVLKPINSIKSEKKSHHTNKFFATPRI